MTNIRKVTYLYVQQVGLIHPAGAQSAVFTAGPRHCVVIAGEPGRLGPAGVIFNTTAHQLHTRQRENRQELPQKLTGVQRYMMHLSAYCLVHMQSDCPLQVEPRQYNRMLLLSGSGGR